MSEPHGCLSVILAWLHLGQSIYQREEGKVGESEPTVSIAPLHGSAADGAGELPKCRNQKLNETALNVTAFMKRLITRSKGGRMPGTDRIGTNTKSLLCY